MAATRRLFLQSSSLAMFGFGASPPWLRRVVAAPAIRRKKVLVAIFQRGGMDGLNVVVPFGEKNYSKLRPNIGISAPNRGENSAIDLDGFFGLHPALAPLKPIYDAKQLAIVEAVGSPTPTRSHFDAQDYMESGTPGQKSTPDGWLNRALARGKDSSRVRAISLGSTLARTLRGSNNAIAVRSIGQFGVTDCTSPDAFEAEKLTESIHRRPYTPANGAEYANNPFSQNLLRIASMIKANADLEVAFTGMDGWDTHANQAAPLQSLLTQFGSALAAFHRDMGDRMEDIAVVTMSEFGRTAKENRALGTDHGHANVMFVLGGGIRGGRIYGNWPGFEQEQLHEQRDLAVTTDFRDVLGELVARHLDGAPVAQAFPDYTAPKYHGLVVS